MTISSYIKMWNSLCTGTLYLSSLHVSFIHFCTVIHKLRVVSRTFSLKSEYNQYVFIHQTTCDFSVSAIGTRKAILYSGFFLCCVFRKRKTRRFQRKTVEVKDIVSVYYISSARFESNTHTSHTTRTKRNYSFPVRIFERNI